MRTLLLLLSAAAASACVTPQKTLCRTIRWETSGWQNNSWGFHEVSRWSGSILLAYNQDGASLERNTSDSYRNYLISEGHVDRSIINLPTENRNISVDHDSQTYTIRQGNLGTTIWETADPECTRMSGHFLLQTIARGNTTTIAGIPVVHYTGRRQDGETVQVWLAPSLGCTQMKRITYRTNRFGLPTEYTRHEVVSVQLGEPAPALFRIPPNYRPDR